MARVRWPRCSRQCPTGPDFLGVAVLLTLLVLFPSRRLSRLCPSKTAADAKNMETICWSSNGAKSQRNDWNEESPSGGFLWNLSFSGISNSKKDVKAVWMAACCLLPCIHRWPWPKASSRCSASSAETFVQVLRKGHKNCHRTAATSMATSVCDVRKACGDFSPPNQEEKDLNYTRLKSLQDLILPAMVYLRRCILKLWNPQIPKQQ